MAIPWQTLTDILSPVDFAPLRVRPCAAQGFPCPHYVIIPISRGTTGDASKPTNALVFASTEPMQRQFHLRRIHSLGASQQPSE